MPPRVAVGLRQLTQLRQAADPSQYVQIPNVSVMTDAVPDAYSKADAAQLLGYTPRMSAHRATQRDQQQSTARIGSVA